MKRSTWSNCTYTQIIGNILPKTGVQPYTRKILQANAELYKGHIKQLEDKTAKQCSQDVLQAIMSNAEQTLEDDKKKSNVK